MCRLLRVMYTTGLLVCLLYPSRAEGQARKFWITGGSVELYLNWSTIGPRGYEATNRKTKLHFVRTRSWSKIVVETTCLGQKYKLFTEAYRTSKGVPAPEVQLMDGMPLMDFVLDIPPRRSGVVKVRYRAEAVPAQGEGIDQHTVTYTILAQ